MLYFYFLGGVILAGAILTLMVRSWALKNNMVNTPNRIIPQHVTPIAYMGGAGIFAGILLAITVMYFFADGLYYELSAQVKPVAALLCGSSCYLAWGIYDDLKQLKPFPKFVGQLLIAMLSVLLGLNTNMFQVPLVDSAFSVFWILFIVNALNFTDVCDGLAGSICAVTFFITGILLPESRLFCFLIAGSTTGFLFFNFPKASIFLGDAGSHLLGFLLAAEGIMGSNLLLFPDPVIWMVLVSAVPVFELLFITAIRIKKGKPWYRGSPDHFSLRMQKAGFKRWQVDAIASAITAIFVTVACSLTTMGAWLKYLFLATAIVMCAVAWKILLKWEVEK